MESNDHIIEVASMGVPASQVAIDYLVIDYDQNETVLGVEIIGVNKVLQSAQSNICNFFKPAQDAGRRVRVDPDADACYIHLSSGRSARQIASTGIGTLSIDGGLLAVIASSR